MSSRQRSSRGRGRQPAAPPPEPEDEAPRDVEGDDEQRPQAPVPVPADRPARDLVDLVPPEVPPPRPEVARRHVAPPVDEALAQPAPRARDLEVPDAGGGRVADGPRRALPD